MKKLILLCLISLLLSGCATTHSTTYDFGSKNLTEENSNKIIKGTTTEQEVVAILGAPTMKSSSSLGEMWTYTRSITKRQYGWFGTYYDPNASKTSSMTITFDDKGIVKETSTFEMGTMMTGTVEYK